MNYSAKKERGKGVKLSLNDDALNVDVYAYLNYGVSVPKVALAIQEQVKQQLLFMTDLQVNEVNVHIEGVIPEKTTQAVDPDNLFGDDDDESENGEDK